MSPRETPSPLQNYKRLRPRHSESAPSNALWGPFAMNGGSCGPKVSWIAATLSSLSTPAQWISHLSAVSQTLRQDLRTAYRRASSSLSRRPNHDRRWAASTRQALPICCCRPGCIGCCLIQSSKRSDYLERSAKSCFSATLNRRNGAVQKVVGVFRKPACRQTRIQILSHTLAPGNSLETFLRPVQR